MRQGPGSWAAGSLLLVLAVAGCGDDVVDDATSGRRIAGSGNVINESRDVSGFDEIVVLGSGKVLVDVTGTESLTIAADDNLMELLTTEVDGTTLELGVDSDTTISPSEDIEYRITAADLAGVSILGGANIVVTGVDSPSFDVLIAGAGDVQPSGTAESLTVEIGGAGDFAGEALITARGSVTIGGTGSAVVNVTDELDVSIGGVGDVEYIGEPTITQSIGGSGTVTQR